MTIDARVTAIAIMATIYHVHNRSRPVDLAIEMFDKVLEHLEKSE